MLSKKYLYSVFGDRATHRWEPFPLLPVTEHSPDLSTMNAAIAMVEEFDPDMVFVNLGDVDRVGHSDLTGTTLRAARTAALTSTNLQVGRFVDLLKSSGRWSSSMVVVLADHSMDWSVPEHTISLTSVFDADTSLTGQVPDRPERRRRPRLLDRAGSAPRRCADPDALARPGHRRASSRRT